MISLIACALAPRVIRAESPSADLYLRNACAAWIGEGGPLRRLAPGVFASQEAVLVIRHASGQRLPARRRLYWLIDDAIGPALRDTGLPIGQRAKLWLYERQAEAAMLAAGAEIVVPSGPLRARYADRARTHLIHPYWGLEPAETDHHRMPGPVRLVYLGSAVHEGDLAFLAPTLRAVLDARPQAVLHLAANHRAACLAGHPRVIRFAQTAWPDYRAALVRWRFHIGLYPLLPTEVNRARSRSKLTEHAIVGAAGIYSAGWPEAGVAARAGAGLMLPPDPDAWREAILRLVDAPEARHALAVAGRELAIERDEPYSQRNFWRHELGL